MRDVSLNRLGGLDKALAWATKVVEAINHDIEGAGRSGRPGGWRLALSTNGAGCLDDVERANREAHGQAVATLTRIFGDLTLAKDAVQDAFVAAVARWPNDGVPDNPAGVDRDDRAEPGRRRRTA